MQECPEKQNQSTTFSLLASTEGIHERTEHLDIFSTHHSMFCLQVGLSDFSVLKYY